MNSFFVFVLYIYLNIYLYYTYLTIMYFVQYIRNTHTMVKRNGEKLRKEKKEKSFVINKFFFCFSYSFYIHIFSLLCMYVCMYHMHDYCMYGVHILYVHVLYINMVAER